MATADLHYAEAHPRTAIDQVIPGPTEADPIVGKSEVLRKVLEDTRRLSQTDAKVLITGESGTGKELVASFVHTRSRRARGPFVAVNCAGVPETLLESELFGHVKGSFTGAYRDKLGKFEQAHRGTLFLDEVGEMTLRMQSLLLRVLETGEVQKVGSDNGIGRTDARVVAATNRHLPDLIREGLFREDLYYRLNVIHIHMPPLRDRQGDIPLLVDHFLRRALQIFGVKCECAPDFYTALESYNWPGNVRQLDNLIQRIVINSRSGVLTAADLPQEIRTASAALPGAASPERKPVADVTLFDQVMAGASFWDAVYKPYMEHEITNDEVRALVEKALSMATGNYRVVTRLFNMPLSDYKRFMNFLRKHHCLLPYREYRRIEGPRAQYCAKGQ